MRWKDGTWLKPQASLSAEQLCVMSQTEVVEHFAPYMPSRTEATRASVPSSMAVHLFPALHSRRPACGRRLPFEPSNSTFSKAHATCVGCIEAVSDEAEAA